MKPKKIADKLALLSEHPNSEHKLYKCLVCGQLWQYSLDWTRGNKPYIFKVPFINKDNWSKKPFVQPDELFNRIGRIQTYFQGASFEEQSQKCRHEGCSNQTIKSSVFCALHHMESIGIKILLPDDFTWFAPYEKENFELSIEKLKMLPKYKALI